jgi:hypothetical protein
VLYQSLTLLDASRAAFGRSTEYLADLQKDDPP